ncbi:hypothetical protein LCGC14_2668140, partial [marine sediment metagenome]
MTINRQEIEGLYIAIVLALVGVVILYVLNRYVSGELASTLFILLLLALAALTDEPQQVLTNLVTNAYQAMPDDGHLTITAALPSDHSPLSTPHSPLPTLH